MLGAMDPSPLSAPVLPHQIYLDPILAPPCSLPRYVIGKKIEAQRGCLAQGHTVCERQDWGLLDLLILGPALRASAPTGCCFHSTVAM